MKVKETLQRLSVPVCRFSTSLYSHVREKKHLIVGLVVFILMTDLYQVSMDAKSTLPEPLRYGTPFFINLIVTFTYFLGVVGLSGMWKSKGANKPECYQQLFMGWLTLLICWALLEMMFTMMFPGFRF